MCIRDRGWMICCRPTMKTLITTTTTTIIMSSQIIARVPSLHKTALLSCRQTHFMGWKYHTNTPNPPWTSMGCYHWSAKPLVKFRQPFSSEREGKREIVWLGSFREDEKKKGKDGKGYVPCLLACPLWVTGDEEQTHTSFSGRMV